MKPNNAIIFMLIVFVLGLIGCSGGGGGSSTASSAPPPAVVTGSAVKGPVEGANVQLFYFDNNGDPIEIVSPAAPVLTDASGAFSFPVNGQDLMGITSPLLVRTSGGTMGGESAPQLEAIIADPMPLTFSQVSLTCHLSVASSVAAGLLINEAQAIGAAPTRDDAEWFMDLVESQLQVGLADDPADPRTPNGMFNYCIDQNLGLETPPDEAGELVMDLIAYFTANLSSHSGILDDTMDDPGNPGTDIPAAFTPFGVGVNDLASLLAGPRDFIIMNLTSDVDYVENDGADMANIVAVLRDATGAPYADLAPVQMGLDSGPGVLLAAGTSAARGEVRGTLTGDQAGNTGEIVVRTDFELPHNANTISLNIAVQAVDFYVDTDGDGFSDGDEVLGWKCVIDEVGYGSLANGTLLTTRSVTSDPNVYDTDNDGLSDYEEYQIQTDPRTVDTDGDGLTDYEEWNIWISNPSSVDTDGDARGPNQDLAPASALFDGQELFLYSTSPTLSDTDADGKTDFEEVDHPSRSPLVSDLPKLEMEIVDAVDVRLDVTYAEETGSSFEYGGELTQSTTTSTSQYNENSINLGVELGYSFTAGLFPKGTASAKLSFDYGHKWSTTRTSSNTAQQSHSQYTTDSRTRTETAATGSLSAGIRLRNPSDITYTLSKLGVTVRHWELKADEESGQMVKSFQTVATLVPALGTGITLAPGEETPVLQVQATDLNPDRVKELLRRPDSLYLESAYFELENAQQVNFDYLSEVNIAQTAGIVIDKGDANAVAYRVATNVQRGIGGTYPGVTLGTILNDILDIDYTTIERQEVDPASPTNERVLFSLQGLATDLGNPDQNFWVVIHESEHPSSGLYDFDEDPVRAGDRVLLIYVRDDDGDGLNALEEQHYGTYTSGASDADYDGDGLTDYTEVRDGWKVTWTDAGGMAHEYQVLSDPASKDQDGDGLEDDNEMAQGTNPSNPDTDRDGIPDNIDPWPLYQAQVLFVDQNVTETGSNDGSSWALAYSDLQDALEDADLGEGNGLAADDVAEIWVADGTYKPSVSDGYAPTFRLVSDVGVYGGFRGQEPNFSGETKRSQREQDPRVNGTILSGDLGVIDDISDNSGYVVSVDHASRVILDGFLISDGNAVPLYSQGIYYAGGMVVIGGPVTLRNLLFVDNQGVNGGGLYVVSLGSEVRIFDCVFSGNSVPDYETTYGGGGGMYAQNSSIVTLDGCRFIGNATVLGGSGGALYSRADSLTIKNTDFQYNDAATTWSGTTNGGAIFAYTARNLVVENCRFIGNRARYRGGAIAVAPFSVTTRARMTNSLFWQNEVVMNDTGSRGGAIWAEDDARLSIVNCTIAENKTLYTPQGGGIMFQKLLFQDSLIIENTILWGNQAAGVADFDAQVWLYEFPMNNRMINASCVQGIESIRFQPQFGLDCIWDDPQFKSTSGTLTLESGSPCIDTANTFVDADPLTPGFQALAESDLAGNPRIVDGDEDGITDVDMGAYEYQP